MQIPFVIDNQQHTIADLLNIVLAEYAGKALDVATAYFNVGGWALLREGLAGLGHFRLLLGAAPASGADLELRPAGDAPVPGLIEELACTAFNAAPICIRWIVPRYRPTPNIKVMQRFSLTWWPVTGKMWSE